jgi:hypothetical protein
MLVACRLAGLSALGAHYADENTQAQFGVKEQQERRHPRSSEAMGRPSDAYSLSWPWRFGERLFQGRQILIQMVSQFECGLGHYT